MTDHHLEGSISVERRGHVPIGRIDGGPLGELLPGAVADLADLVTTAETDDGVRAVVLTGDHPSRFVAHASIRWLQQGGAANHDLNARSARTVARAAAAARQTKLPLVGRTPLRGAVELDEFHQVLLRMNGCGAVFVAALNGSALGGGCELALACDLRVMARGDHVIGQPEVLLGFIPGGGGTQRLPRLVGTHRALDLILEGVGLRPDEALAIGLVDEVVAPDDLLAAAVERGAHLARRDKAAVGAAKRSVYLGSSLPLPDALRLERAEFLQILSLAHTQSLMLAYQEATRVDGELPLYRAGGYAEAVETGRVATTTAPTGPDDNA